jgi:hypothetical protein
MSFKCFRFISNVNFVLYTNQRPFVFSKQQQWKWREIFELRSSYVTRKREIRKIRVSGPGCSGIWVLYECFSSNKTRTIVHIIKNGEFIGVRYRAVPSFKIRSPLLWAKLMRRTCSYKHCPNFASFELFLIQTYKSLYSFTSIANPGDIQFIVYHILQLI